MTTPTEEERQLKPCPFCGSEAAAHYDHARCSKRCFGNEWYPVKMWNRRSPEASKEAREALELFVDVCDSAPPMEFTKRIGAACERAKKALLALGESSAQSPTDSERLDFIEANPALLNDCTWVNYSLGRLFSMTPGGTLGECPRTFRAAITAAMQREKGEA